MTSYCLVSVQRAAAGAVLLSLLALVPATAAGPSPTSPVRVDGLEGESAAPSRAPTPQAVLAGWVYFPATDARHGRELWRSDGSSQELVADLCPGRCSSSPDNLVVIGDGLLFSADDGVSGREPWQSDGSAGGTARLADICFGRCSSLPAPDAPFPFAPVALHQEIYFAASNGFGFDLWKTDGTTRGTVAVTATYRSGGPSVEPRGLTAFGDTLYFSGTDGLHGRELWASDGTRQGTRRVRDFCAGACSSEAELLAATGDRLLLAAAAVAPDARTVWTIDLAGTVAPFGDLCAAGCRRLAAVPWQGGLAVATDEVAGSRLWTIDFTPGGTRELGRFFAVRNLTPSGAQLFFTADEAASGEELWATDGTALGTRLVRDLEPGASSSSPLALTPFAGGVVFHAVTSGLGREPWVSDGTAAGTRSLGDLDPGWDRSSQPARFVVLADRVLFAAQSSSSRDLWRSDGTAAGTAKVFGLATARIGPDPAGLTAWGDRLAFAGPGRNVGREPWLAHGGRAALLTALDFSANSAPRDFAVLEDRLYFVDRGPSGDQLWKSDGTPSGTVALPGEYQLSSSLVAAGSTLYFLAGPSAARLVPQRAAELSEPFRLQGAEGSPALLSDINPGYVSPFPDRPNFQVPAGSRAHDLTVVGGRLYFGADDGVTGDEPWSSDGTAAGTVRVADLCPGACSSRPLGFVSLGGRILLATPGSEVEMGALWRLDGASGVELQTFPPTRRIGGGGPRELVVLAGRAYFLAAELGGGDALWASDGTGAGTLKISDLRTAAEPGEARSLTVAGSRLFFTSYHAGTGEELWVSDGTTAGTRQVADLWPGPRSSSPRDLTVVDGRLLFAAAEPATGLELWTSDGSSLALLGDIARGSDSSSPEELTAAGELIYFSADDGAGRTLWALPRTALGAPVCRPDATTLCLQQGRFEVRVSWRDPNGPGASRSGQAVPRSEQTGLFWFFSPGNIELLVKVLDGRGVNGRFWVFFGALSNVAYQVTVRDVATGAVHTYSNPQGTLCGQGDTGSFAAPAGSTASVAPAAPVASTGAVVAVPKLAVAVPPARTATTGSCQPAVDALCLLEGRFRVEVTFRDQHAGGVEGKGMALPGTAETGFFWFFGRDNLELAVKILDGSAVNGHHWVLYGALTDVEYDLTVTDTATGARKVYHSPPGQLCGGADAAAF